MIFSDKKAAAASKLKLAAAAFLILLQLYFATRRGGAVNAVYDVGSDYAVAGNIAYIGIVFYGVEKVGYFSAERRFGERSAETEQSLSFELRDNAEYCGFAEIVFFRFERRYALHIKVLFGLRNISCYFHFSLPSISIVFPLS